MDRDKYMHAPSSRAGLTHHFLADKTFQSNASTQKTLRWCGQPRSTDALTVNFETFKIYAYRITNFQRSWLGGQVYRIGLPKNMESKKNSKYLYSENAKSNWFLVVYYCALLLSFKVLFTWCCFGMLLVFKAVIYMYIYIYPYIHKHIYIYMYTTCNLHAFHLSWNY